MEINQEKVQLNGASGYIVLHCISELFKEGYKIKGSLRDLKRENEARKSLGIEFPNEKLKF